MAPKGVRANFAILKHCIPNGIPMIVQHNSAPLITAPNARRMPLKMIQNTFAITEKAPPPYWISLPNGKKTSSASLKHCSPMGMPIIVMHHKTPARTQASPCQRPQNKNQRVFPKQPILIHLASILCFGPFFGPPIFFEKIIFYIRRKILSAGFRMTLCQE